MSIAFCSGWQFPRTTFHLMQYTPSVVCKSVQRGRTDPLLHEIRHNVLAATAAETKRVG
jgi:hypothetical protein